MGVGSIVARQAAGRLIDWNFRRHARRCGTEIQKGQQTSLENFLTERARLEVAFPVTYAACAPIIAYGWIMNMSHPPVAAVLVVLFFLMLCLSSGMQAISVLIVDCYLDSPSAATAAGNSMMNAVGRG